MVDPLKSDGLDSDYLTAIRHKDFVAINNLAIAYHSQGQTELAEQYYLEALYFYTKV